MAAKKTKSTAANQTSTLEFGAPNESQLTLPFVKDAEGRSLLKPGFSISPAFDVAFALGFPYLVCPQVVTTVSTSEVLSATKALTYDRWRILPSVADRTFRLLACNGVRLTPVPGTFIFTDKGEGAVALDAPVEEAEVEQSFKEIFSEAAPTFTFFLADLALLVEPSLGASNTARALIGALEATPDTLLRRNDPERAALVQRLGFILLRTPQAAAAEHRARLRAWLDDRIRVLPGGTVKKRSKTEGVGSIWRSIDLVVNGDEAIERSAYRVGSAPDVTAVSFASNEKYVLKALGARPKGLVAPLDARLAFIGGEEALSILVKQMSGLPAEYLPRYIETFGVIRSPLIVKWLKSIAKKTPIAEQTLQLHAS